RGTQNLKEENPFPSGGNAASFQAPFGDPCGVFFPIPAVLRSRCTINSVESSPIPDQARILS
ncbi:hypothetical protein AVEN_251963-1, partial [Araneus ventricosus]